MIPVREKNLKSMIDENSSEINKIEYVFLGTKSRIPAKQVPDFPLDIRTSGEMSEARVTERAQV